MILRWKRGRKERERALAAQESMDKLSVWFCDQLHATNSFVVEISAGHVVSIGKELR